MTARWRTILDHPEHGQGLRAFCRLATRSNHWFQRFSLATFGERASKALIEEDWETAAACMVQIAQLVENTREPHLTTNATTTGGSPTEDDDVSEAGDKVTMAAVAVQALYRLLMHHEGTHDGSDDDTLRARVVEDVQAGRLAAAAFNLGMMARRQQIEDFRRMAALEDEEDPAD